MEDNQQIPLWFKRLQGCYFRRRHAYQAAHQAILGTVQGWEVPSQAIRPLLRNFRFEVVKAHLPPDRLAETDFARWQIRLAADLAEQLHHKPAARGVINVCLAHEIAHIVLGHKPRGGKVFRHWEDEAKVWAAQFLCPWWLLGRRHEIVEVQRGCLPPKRALGNLYDVADWLGVPVGYLRRALELYGILDYGQLRYPTPVGRSA